MSLDGISAILYGDSAPQKSPALPLPEAQIMELRAAFARYNDKCPFKAGDIITPRANVPILGAGTPYIVLEFVDTNSATVAHGDICVATFSGTDFIHTHNVDSWMFEHYTGDGVSNQEGPAGVGNWIEWSGGDCPVTPETQIEAEFRCGTTDIGAAQYFKWSHGLATGYDIMRYRIVS